MRNPFASKNKFDHITMRLRDKPRFTRKQRKMTSQIESRLYSVNHRIDVYIGDVPIGYLIRKTKIRYLYQGFQYREGYWTAFVYLPKLDNSERKCFYHYIWNTEDIPTITYSDDIVAGWSHDNPHDEIKYTNLVETIKEIWITWSYISKFQCQIEN
ncbi:hypothetical protein [Acanthamoeba polyphaga mimivirus]|uniref:Uncharacterized protein n=3 Tax=Megamimivirinae TaxID=3044648 RepID=A0A2L2DNE3_MIMIV|nr:hypothetical protein MegaChil _gp0830 [Megavirus chiliensis]AFX92935.1 hypothetical protein CE11_00909 [Megavirus courdo11]AVG46555.1 hypothetical protein [Acanthamoeba polyphaga mimivirus]AVL94141.1 hypothetical protein mvi_781 [Megavirus vitis]AEQ32786.1 hypothetical protein [Megavirus chiliensis]AVG47666.1 hypothetical protein [Acanthamoeba polyphaga mimivirus]